MKENVAALTVTALEPLARAGFNREQGLVTRYPQPDVKSPLRYPGGKSRAVRQILDLMPGGLNTLCSPFIGGGSIELACAAIGMRVHGYDAFEPLVQFWQTALDDAPLLAERVAEYYPLSRTDFYALQKGYFSISERFGRAAAFYALNRASFSGTTLSGGMSPGHPRFTQSSIERLRNFSADNLSVGLADFRESIPSHGDHFMYLDPPYANGERLYGDRGDMHEDFDHAALADLLHARNGWILSYNDSPYVRSLYRGHRFIEMEWSYGMANRRSSNEIIILSRD